MRILKMTLLAILAVLIVLLIIANRETVTVELLPSQLGFLTTWNQQMPLSVVMIVMATGGFALGWFWEWLRDQRTRTVAKQRRRQIVALEREVTTLRRDSGAVEDDVLELLK
ncbi:Protein of unknown function [Monaibacterium marinum]|uniref:Lipopolysaccharide assembly protein A domain-containing protein n=1 Tax=Pontivivens marinum TaxID=1690039 RepID=A0A2C9CN51_9RHOB|nr:LapA family protein [Monaibacterium marinum]SOH92638.1 Protein of unknown function [Monaibacterium marinum]